MPGTVNLPHEAADALGLACGGDRQHILLRRQREGHASEHNGDVWHAEKLIFQIK